MLDFLTMEVLTWRLVERTLLLCVAGTLRWVMAAVVQRQLNDLPIRTQDQTANRFTVLQIWQNTTTLRNGDNDLLTVQVVTAIILMTWRSRSACWVNTYTFKWSNCIWKDKVGNDCINKMTFMFLYIYIYIYILYTEYPTIAFKVLMCQREYSMKCLAGKSINHLSAVTGLCHQAPVWRCSWRSCKTLSFSGCCMSCKMSFCSL